MHKRFQDCVNSVILPFYLRSGIILNIPSPNKTHKNKCIIQ